jgi:hypothetical protein
MLRVSVPRVSTDDRERAAREIALAAKRLRKPVPRGMWIVALVVGIGCTIAAAVAWTASGDAPDATDARTTPPRRAIDSGPRFGMGIGIGLGAGLVIGFALGRGRRRDQPRHSPASKP